ncbi:MAG TPA: HD domain-containing phosphohydrolase, partial [Symbiobacteriaceae bacterium]|nr:HD domain-containing phosphohydrolase [Symbiobacteriaceae bacterium]
MEGILRSIVAAGYRQLQGRGLVLFRYDPLSDSFPDEWRLVEGEVARRYSTQMDLAGITARVLRSRKPLVVQDTARLNVRSFVGVPVDMEGVPWGVLYVTSPEPHSFTDSQVEFVAALARHIGATVSASLPGGTGSVELSTVRVLAATVDAKDHYTRHHSTNVSFYARLLAREMSLDPAEVRRIDLAGLLHDIGKIAIPDHILQKPGPLTAEEWLLVQTHAAIGANILAQASHLQHLVPLIRHHHERYDGTGYPDGLKGDEIPLGAAILNLADSFDTMTTRRVYRAPLSLEQSLAEVRRCSGTQFHPAVVRAMENLVAKAKASGESWIVSLEAIEGMRSGFPNDWGWQGDSAGVPLEVHQNRDPLDFLVEARLIQHLQDLQVMLERAGEQTLDFWAADALFIYLVNQEEGTLQLAWSGGSDSPESQGLLAACRSEPTLPMTQGLAGWAAITNQGITVSDARRDPRWAYNGVVEGPVSVLVAPLGAQGAPIGVIQLVARGENCYGWEDVKVMKVYGTLLGQGIERVGVPRDSGEAHVTDALTGAKNAVYLRQLLQQLEHSLWEVPMCVSFLDADDLKGINDRYGHESGDLVIRHVARCLQAWRRPGDVVVRAAGDEFIILFGGLSLPEASARLERIRMTISETPVELPGGRRA